MKDILEAKLMAIANVDQRLNLAREFLQHLFLTSLDRSRDAGRWAFVGGTALRILYDLPRFSEDLDFSYIGSNPDQFQMEHVNKQAQEDFEGWGFDVSFSPIKGGNVLRTFLRISNLPKDLFPEQDPRRKVSIKVEIDARPPQGYRTEITTLQKELLFNVVHFDLPSLFAGKVHAILFRGFAKGRDFYDLLWYLAKKVPLNVDLLIASCRQTEPEFSLIQEENLRQRLTEKIEAASFKALEQEIHPLLERPEDLRLFTKENILRAIEGIRFEEADCS